MNPEQRFGDLLEISSVVKATFHSKISVFSFNITSQHLIPFYLRLCLMYLLDKHNLLKLSAHLVTASFLKCILNIIKKYIVEP